MISIKTGTQTFSENSHSAKLKGDGSNTLSADEMKKHYGDEPIGDILNKVADPNWIDPAKKRRQVGSNELGKDAFMKLLMTQIKNQDPSNPMKSHEMAAQLAQFSSLEQLSNINTNMEAMNKANESKGSFDVLKMIGMQVQGDSSKLSRGTLQDKHDIQFNLLKDADKVTVEIKDQQGNVVRELQANNLKQGKNEIAWNGEIEDGSQARPGDYRVEINANSSSGKVGVQTAFSGIISGVNFSSTGPVLMIGNKSVKLSDIKSLSDPSKMNLGNENVKKVAAKAVERDTDGVKQVETQLDGVSMSRDMINKLKKAGAGTKAY